MQYLPPVQILIIVRNFKNNEDVLKDISNRFRDFEIKWIQRMSTQIADKQLIFLTVRLYALT